MNPVKTAEYLENGCIWRDGILRSRTTGRRVRALLPVHVLGHPADMTPLLELARKFHLAVIEDATESLGATYRDRPVGQWGDIACVSFNGNKLLTTGGGGMLLTNNAASAQRAKYLTTQAKDDPIEYVHGAIGYNYRLTNIQAAMGCAQMELLDEYIAAKRRIAARYTEAFADLASVTPMREAPWASSVFWMFTVLLDESRGLASRTLLKRFQERKIQTRPLWQPLHQSPAHAGAPAVASGVAERLYHHCLSLPCSVGLRPEDQERVIACLREFAADQ
jgi:perosamine synthetase